MRLKHRFIPKAEELERINLLSAVAVAPKPAAVIKAAAQVTTANFVSKSADVLFKESPVRPKHRFIPKAEELERINLLSAVAVAPKPAAVIKAAAQVTTANFVSKSADVLFKESPVRPKHRFIPKAEELERINLLSAVAVAPKPAAVIKAAAQVTTANFVSKSVADHTVVSYGSAFTQTFKLQNTGNTTWSGFKLVLVSASDHLGAASSVSVPTTAPGQTATINMSLQANKTSGSGAAQLAYWNLMNGSTVIPIRGTSYSNSVAKNKVWTEITVDAPIGPGYPRLNTAGYGSANPYVKDGYGGQCTAFVWGRVYEMGFSTQFPPVSGDAGQPWIDAANNSAHRYTVSPTPRANSIAVWSGHVAYVESVNGSTVVISEANRDSYNSYAAVNDPTGAYTWGGGYDGNQKYLTVSSMKTYNGQTLLGYIYV